MNEDELTSSVGDPMPRRNSLSRCSAGTRGGSLDPSSACGRFSDSTMSRVVEKASSSSAANMSQQPDTLQCSVAPPDTAL